MLNGHAARNGFRKSVQIQSQQKFAAAAPSANGLATMTTTTPTAEAVD